MPRLTVIPASRQIMTYILAVVKGGVISPRDGVISRKFTGALCSVEQYRLHEDFIVVVLRMLSCLEKKKTKRWIGEAVKNSGC